jgi:hypothetical protein
MERESGGYKVGLGAFRMRCSLMVFPSHHVTLAGWPTDISICNGQRSSELCPPNVTSLIQVRRYVSSSLASGFEDSSANSMCVVPP